MSDAPMVIEPGTEAWALLAQAIRTGKKVSISDFGGGRFRVKVSEFMWSPVYHSIPATTRYGSGPGFEPPANT